MGIKRRPSSNSHLWPIVEANVVVGDDGGINADALVAALQELPDNELIAFDREVSAAFSSSRTWSLWGAAVLIHDGCPDDTFDYFRSWLIGRGRVAFEAAMRNPDSLADIATPEALDDQVYSVSEEVLDERGIAVSPGPEHPPLNKSFELSDDAELERRYPRLWRRFRG